MFKDVGAYALSFHLSNSRSCVRVLTAFKSIKFNFMLQTWDMLVFVARLQKGIILPKTLAKRVEKTKLKS